MRLSLKRGRKPSSFRREQRRFRGFLTLLAALSLALLTLVQTVATAHEEPKDPLTNRIVDSILATSLTALLGTLLASSTVAIILDEYQKRFSAEDKSYEQFANREGILATYESSQQPKLVTALEEAIGQSRIHILGIGLGLSVLMNHVLLTRIGERLTVEKQLRVDILLGDGENNGVKNRTLEEHQWHALNDLAYDPSWPHYFALEIATTLKRHAGELNADRVTVNRVNSYPTVGLLKFDSRLFFFLYGAPSMRGGSQSVWIELDASTKGGYINAFFDRYITFFEKDVKAEPGDKISSETGAALTVVNEGLGE